MPSWSKTVKATVAARARESGKCQEALTLLEQGWSQRKVANSVGVQASTVARWATSATRLQHGTSAAGAGATEAPLTEAEIAAARAAVARRALQDEDWKTALEAMRDEAKRQRLEAEVHEVHAVHLVHELTSTSRADRLRELRDRATRLGLHGEGGGVHKAVEAPSMTPPGGPSSSGTAPKPVPAQHLAISHPEDAEAVGGPTPPADPAEDGDDDA